MHGKCFVVFTPKKGFFWVIRGIREKRENRQPLHVGTWDPIHSCLISDYQRGRWRTRVRRPVHKTSTIHQIVREEKLKLAKKMSWTLCWSNLWFNKQTAAYFLSIHNVHHMCTHSHLKYLQPESLNCKINSMNPFKIYFMNGTYSNTMFLT